jgi:hypothetical protein
MGLFTAARRLQGQLVVIAAVLTAIGLHWIMNVPFGLGAPAQFKLIALASLAVAGIAIVAHLLEGRTRAQ